MSGSKNAKEGGSESAYVVGFILLVAGAWLIWTKARPVIIVPIFALDWVEYKVLETIWLLKDTQGANCLGYVGYYLRHPGQTLTLPWDVVAGIQADLGSRVRWVIAAGVAACAGYVAFKMKGDGFKQKYSLTGRSYEKVVRLMGIEIKAKPIAKLLTADYKISIFKHLAKLLITITGIKMLVKVRKEWVNKGASFMHFQAEHWKVTLAGAHFDPNKRSPGEMPQLSPMEWLRDNKVPLRKGEIDADAAENAFRKQLGPSWQGVEQAPYHVQAICVLAALNFQRADGVNALRERLTEIHVLQPAKAAQATRELLAKHLGNKELVEAINRRGGKHAYLNTAAIGIYGAGGPMKEWGGGEAGVIATSMFRWLKGVDRTLWYCLNNVGRRSFHIEGAGAVSHFQAERVLGQPLIDPYLDSALDGLEAYIEDQSIDDGDAFFRKEKKF